MSVEFERTLTADVASRVLAGDETVDLREFTRIDEDAARILARHDRYLSLNGLTSLSDAVAESLSNFKGDQLSLDGLTSLSDAAAESLSNFKGYWLNLNGLTSLSDAAAASLSKFKGYSLDLKPA